MSIENIVFQIENAHQDALATYDALQEMVSGTEDIVINLSDGTQKTIKSLSNMKSEIISLLTEGRLTSLDLSTTSTASNYYANIPSLVMVDSYSGSDSTGLGTVSAPYASIKKAIESVDSNFVVVLLKNEARKYPITEDIIIENKTVVFDVYQVNGTSLVIGGKGSSALTLAYPTIHPYINTVSANVSVTIDESIRNALLNHLSSGDNETIYSTLVDTAVIGGLYDTAYSIPYYSSFVLKNSKIVMNNVKIVNTLDGTESYPASTPFYTSFSEALSTTFRLRPMPAIFKDFYVTGTTFKTLHNDTYFLGYKNKVVLNNVDVMMYSHLGGLFYFNNILDNSNNYEVILNDVRQISNTSDATGSSIFHRYSPIFYLENNRITTTADNTFLKSAIWNNDETSEVATEYFINKKYHLNLTMNNYKVKYNLIIGELYTGDYGFDYDIQDTGKPYLMPKSFNIFRLVETYVFAFAADQAYTFSVGVTPENYLNLNKYYDDYNLFGIEYTPSNVKILEMTSQTIGTSYTPAESVMQAGTPTSTSPVLVK